ncbi:MAG: PEP-CTERM sorting domain-containing protein, partial [Planctomycetota bacterium]
KGGVFRTSLLAESGSTVNLSGGAFSRVAASAGSSVTFVGGDIRVNGTPADGLLENLRDGDIVSGIFENGTPFIFNRGTDLNGVRLSTAALPDVDVTPIVVGSSSPMTAPAGLRPNQTLTLQEGGFLSHNYAAIGAALHIEGGEVSLGLKVLDSSVQLSGGEINGAMTLFGQSSLHVSGGSISNAGAVNSLIAQSGSQVRLSGGRIGSEARAHADSRFVITGGQLSDRFDALPGSTVLVYGGEIGQGFEVHEDAFLRVNGGMMEGVVANEGSHIRIDGGELQRFNAGGESVVEQSGGRIEDLWLGAGSVFISAGGELTDKVVAAAGSTFKLFGSGFTIDGNAVTNLNVGEALSVNQRDVTLSGTYLDGSTFSFLLNPSGGRVFNGPVFSPEADLSITLLSTAGIQGDYNADGVVGQEDLDLVLLNWGVDTEAYGTPSGWLGMTPDGLIGQHELDGVLLNWGDGTPPATVNAIPEPATLAWFGLVGLSLAARRRRR